MASVELKAVCKGFGKQEILKDIHLTVPSGALTVLVGPSGCGKSTLLRMIAGLETPCSGDVVIDGDRVNDVPPAERGVAMVFQSYALYPHMTVYENMRFGLTSLRLPGTEIRSRIAEAAEMLDLEPYLERKPKQLSGGQRQRVAMGRAVVRRPKVFLFDEPLSNLDAALRVKMRLEIARLRERLNATMIYVTHDQVEAMTLAHKIVVLRSGIVEQEGAPLDVYHRPSNRFVAGFLGSPSMNFIPASSPALPDAVRASTVADGFFGIRPEHLVPGVSTGLSLKGKVYAVEQLGDQVLAHVLLDGHGLGTPGATIIARLPGEATPAAGEAMTLSFDPIRCHVFDRAGATLASGIPV